MLPVLAPQQPALWPRAHSGLLGPLGLICRARVQSTNVRALGVEPEYHPAAVPGPPACHLPGVLPAFTELLFQSGREGTDPQKGRHKG